MCDYVWPYMTLLDSSWLCMTMFYYVWLCTTFYETFWLCIILNDSFGITLTLIDSVLLYLTLFYFVWLCCMVLFYLILFDLDCLWLTLCLNFYIAWFLFFNPIQLCFNLLEHFNLCLTLFNSRSYAQILCLFGSRSWYYG